MRVNLRAFWAAISQSGWPVVVQWPSRNDADSGSHDIACTSIAGSAFHRAGRLRWPGCEHTYDCDKAKNILPCVREANASLLAPEASAMCRTHPIFCILPPHLLKSVCDHGSARQRAWALKTMLTDSTFRALRATLATPAIAAGPRRRGVCEDGQKQRTIYTARNEETLPGAMVRMEGGPPTGDAAVDEAYDGLGDTFDLYWNVFARNRADRSPAKPGK
jgi:hypothetical protein